MAEEEEEAEERVGVTEEGRSWVVKVGGALNLWLCTPVLPPEPFVIFKVLINAKSLLGGTEEGKGEGKGKGEGEGELEEERR